MDNSKKRAKLPDEAELENARVGYQAAINLGMGLNQVIWSIFNTMVVANSIVIAGVGLIINNQPLISLLKMPLSIIGLIMCFVWYLAAKRQRDYLSYYMLSAREIEEKYFQHNIMTLSRGGSLSDGQFITIKLGEGRKTYRMSFLSRLMKGEAASNIIIVVFVAIYVGILFI